MLNVREIVAATLCAPLAVILLNGCAGPVTEADRQLASKFDHELYLAGRNTPAEYAVNQMCSNVLNTMLLKEELVPRDPMRYQTARERLKTLEEDIRKGFEWPEKQPPRVNIPFSRAPIVVDGRADEPAWQEALTFHDEYPISSRRKMESGACWKILWDAEFIYGFFNMPQKTFQVVRERLWLGDAVEWFIGSGIRFRTYWEIVVGTDGSVYDALGQNNRWGAYIVTPTESIRGLKTAVRQDENGYQVEIAIPWREIPGYEHGNLPRPGEQINFTLIRCRKGRQSACHPLLYTGHNIRGHLTGLLTKEAAAGHVSDK